MIISSSQNPIFKKLLSLTKSKGVKEHNQCLASGNKITLELAEKMKQDVFWVCSEKHTLPDGDWQKTVIFTNELFQELDICGTHSPLLCLPLPVIKDFSQWDSSKASLFCSLSDPNNLGAVLRSCTAFGLKQVVLLKESSHPFLPKSIRASSGASFSLNYFSGPSIQELQIKDLVALDMSGESVHNFPFPKDLKILIGEEGQGVPKNFSGKRIHIPMSKEVESLNAATATSILLYEWNKA